MSTTKPIRDKEKLLKFRNYYRTEKVNPRNYALIVLGLNSALRISDLLSLRWNDLYQNGRYVEHIDIIEQKTGKENTLFLNSSSQEALEFYRQSLSRFDSRNYIFTGQKSPQKNLSRHQAFRIIRRAAEGSGLENQHISCHSLRKTFGYHAWKDGIPPALLMSIYNHSSYEITKRYLGIDQSERDKVYMKLSL